MTNREKYSEQILDIVCQGGALAMDKNGELVNCNDIYCRECKFYPEIGIGCEKNIKKWANSEYIEKPKISESDRRFLDYLLDRYKYMVRNKDGLLYIYTDAPKKEDEYNAWSLPHEIPLCMPIFQFNIDFPMVKWEDEELWLIEDLKKLEVE